jgi:GAF domain-containing protein/HAMP domain-containing protein
MESLSSPLRFRRSLSRSLALVLVALSFIPMLIMGGASYLRARALLSRQAISQMESSVTTQMEGVQELARIRLIRLDRLILRPDTHALYERAFHVNRLSPDYAQVRLEIVEAFNAINREGRLFHHFFLLNPRGQVVLASNGAWEGLTLDETRASFLLQQDHATFALYDLRPLYPQELALYSIVQMYTESGSLLGVVVGVSEAPSIEEIFNSIQRLNPQARVYLLNHEGLFLQLDPVTRTIQPFTPFPGQKAQLEGLFQRWQEQKEAAASTVEYETGEEERLIAHLRWVPDLHSVIALEIPQSVLFRDLNSLVPFTVLLFLAVAFVNSLVFSGISRRLVSPLLSLAETARFFAEGDFRMRSPLDRREDEIGFLAVSFNRMADELSAFYRRLELQIEERTRQVQTAAEVAQSLTVATDLNDLLNRTVRLIVERFQFYHAGIFLLDESRRYAILRAAYSPAAEALLRRGHRLEVGSASIVGWVAANRRPRAVSDVTEDPLHLKNELLPETRAEAAIPILAGDSLLGVLDVQSTQAERFDEETLLTLQTLANQLAYAIQNVGQVETIQTGFREIQRLYQVTRKLLDAGTPQQALESGLRALRQMPYGLLILEEERGAFHPSVAQLPSQVELPAPEFSLSSQEILPLLAQGSFLVEGKHLSTLPAALNRWLSTYAPSQVGLLALWEGEQPKMLFVLFAVPPAVLSPISLQSYAAFVDLLSLILARLQGLKEVERRLREQEALAELGRSLAAASDMMTICSRLHEQVRRIIGEYAFLVALYDPQTDSIEIPYRYSEGEIISSTEPFPLGEGLTSILIRSRQPLLLVENTEYEAARLGAKVVGKAAKSWMGVPILVQNQAIGALIVQDLERERQFDEEDVRFLTAIASQAGGLLYNVRILEETRKRALQIETAAEIARDISTALNLDELLKKAVDLIRERFDFYHAAVFLLDENREYAVIREATGEAGAQLKRQGHKLAVGSKSIVGYVSSRGEPLVVNDTARDATYYPNPLLPETRAEAALPLRVGERILGVLDVQSTKPYTFDEDSLRTLRILADQLAIAVLNAELFAAAQETLAQQRLLHHVTSAAAAASTLEEALQSAVQGIQVTLGGDRVSILLLSKDRKMLEMSAFAGYSEEARNIRIPVSSGITGWVVQNRQPLRVGDVSADPRYIQVSPEVRSELAVPLIYRGEVLGVLNVESDRPNAYSESDEEMLSTLAGSLAAIIANARLLEQLRRQMERQRLLLDITSKIRRSGDLDSILRTTAGELLRAMRASHAEVRLLLQPEQSPEDGGER